MPDPRVYDPTRPDETDAFYQGTVAPEPVPAGDLEEHYSRLYDSVERLSQQIRSEKRRIPVLGVTSHQLDADGNATFPIYQAGAGFYFYLEALNIEVATFDATNPRTPAAPYANASFWLGVFRSPNPNSVAQGGMVDFLPTSTAMTIMLPAIGVYDPPRLVRSQDYLVASVHVGPASQLMTVTYQGYLEGVES